MRHSFLIIALASLFHLGAQNKKIDSLISLLKIKQPDTLRLLREFEAGMLFYMDFSFDSAKAHLRKSRELAIKTGSEKKESNILNLLGAIGYYTGENEQALEYYGAALKIKTRLNDKPGMAMLLGNIAGIYSNQGRFYDAISNHNQALQIHTAIKSKNVSVDHNGLGEAYRQLGNHGEALNHYFIALRLAEEFKDDNMINQIYNNIGIVYEDEDNLADALKFYGLCISNRESKGEFKQLAGPYHNIAVVFLKMKNYSKAEKYFRKAMALNREIGDKNFLASNYNGFSALADAQGKTELAMRYNDTSLMLRRETGDESGIARGNIDGGNLLGKMKKYALARTEIMKGAEIAKKLKVHELLMSAYQNLTLLDSIQGDFSSAFEHHKLFAISRDSVINAANAKKSIEARMQYDFDKKENELRLEQEKKDVEAKELLRKKEVQRNYFIFGFVVLSVGVLAILRSYRQKQKANVAINHQKMIIEEKQKEIVDSIMYAKRIQQALLPSEKYFERHLKK